MAYQINQGISRVFLLLSPQRPKLWKVFGSESPMKAGFLQSNADSLGLGALKGPEVLAVSELVRRIAGLLERQFPLLRVRGEISNLSVASSGHHYFSLKDRQSQIRCVMFRNKAQFMGFRPKEGDMVEVLAQLSVYEPRGDIQLQIEQMRPAGQGDLQLQFLRLKQKLQAEGLFDQERKRVLPELPRAIWRHYVLAGRSPSRCARNPWPANAIDSGDHLSGIGPGAVGAQGID